MFKTVLWLVVALLAVLRCPVGAQTKVFRIGYLGIGAGPNKSFLQGMETLGYVKDKNVVIEYRALPSSVREIKEIVTEFVRLDVDVIYAGPPSAVAAAKQVTDRIPIVMNAVTDPIERIHSEFSTTWAKHHWSNQFRSSTKR